MTTAEWLTAAEVATELRFFRGDGKPNVQLVQRMAHRGELPGTKINRFWRFRRDHLDAYLDQNTVLDSYQRAAINAAARKRSAS